MRLIIEARLEDAQMGAAPAEATTVEMKGLPRDP